MPNKPTVGDLAGVLDDAILLAEQMRAALPTTGGAFHHPVDPRASIFARHKIAATVAMAAQFTQRALGVPILLRLDGDGWEVLREDWEEAALDAITEEPAVEHAETDEALRIYETAAELAGRWRPILDSGNAVGISKVELADDCSDELRDEHGRRVLRTAAALPLAVELTAVSSGRAVEMVFPVAVDGMPGYGLRYGTEGGAA